MEKHQINELLFKYNFWDKTNKTPLGFIREGYLNEIQKYLGNNLIKVLVGQRRSGKSFLLRQIIDFLINKKSIPAKNIFYINLENEKFSFVQTTKDLAKLVDFFFDEICENKKKKCYLFFDEIQEIPEWEKLINSYRADHNLNIEIFITGSNSKLLSSDFATYLTGRYLEKNIYPLNYSEYIAIHKLSKGRESLEQYLSDSQLPELISEKDDDIKASYIRSIKNSILYNDVVKRFNVQDVDLLEKLFLFIVDNIGNPFSVNSICNELKRNGSKTNPTTLGNYVKYLEYSYLIYGVQRFDIKGRQIIEGTKKFYINDLGFRNFLSSSFDPGISKKLENYSFQSLLNAGFDVHIGSLENNKEIDFIAEKHDRKIYLQVCYKLDSDKTIDREYGNLELINDNWEKYVVSMDGLKINPKEGIKHINAWDLFSIL